MGIGAVFFNPWEKDKRVLTEEEQKALDDYFNPKQEEKDYLEGFQP